MGVTIRQIAEMCNVSRGTVDRVLHDRPNVHPQIRQAVLQAVAQAGYALPERSQPRFTQRTAGILMPGWPDKYFLAHSQRGVKNALDSIDPARFSLVTERLGGRSVEEHLEGIDRLLAQGVEGIILNAPMAPPIIERLNRAAARGVRILTVFDELPQCPHAIYVGQDVLRSGRVAAGLMAKYLQPGERVLTVTGDLSFHSHRGRAYSFAHHLRRLTGSDGLVDIACTREFREATAQTVRQRLAADQSIRYIYMATQSVPGCVDGIRRAALPHRVAVICNDTTAAARGFLLSGDVDFVIGQSVSQTVSQAVEALYSMLCLGIEPKESKLFGDLTIYTRQMLDARTEDTP